MLRTGKKVVFSLAFTAILLLLISGSAFAQAGVTTLPGTLSDGATFLIEKPANWNGTLFLYSHGYVVPGAANPAEDVGDLGADDGPEAMIDERPRCVLARGAAAEVAPRDEHLAGGGGGLIQGEVRARRTV